MKKTTLATLVALIASLSLAACGSIDDSSSDKQIKLGASLDTTTSVTEGTTNSETEASSETTTEPITTQQDNDNSALEMDETKVIKNKVNAEIGKKFSMKLDEIAQFGQNETTLEITEILYFENSKSTRIDYTFKKGGVEYIGRTFVDDDGETWSPFIDDKYNSNEIIVSSYNNNTIELTVMPETVIAPPMKISGNSKDTYVTKDYEYIETDNFVLYLDKDVKIRGDVTKNIQIIMDEVEKQSGLKFDSKTTYAKRYSENTAELHLGKNYFKGVNPLHTKLDIFVLDDKDHAGYAISNTIIINACDVDFSTNETSTLVHTLCQLIEMKNGEQMNLAMDGGFAAGMTDKVIKNCKAFPNIINNRALYSSTPITITKENVEKIFRTKHTSSYDYGEMYYFGLRFNIFLRETYGEFVFNDILSEVNTLINSNFITTSENEIYEPDCDIIIQALKKNTSNDVFEKFVEWNKTYKF